MKKNLIALILIAVFAASCGNAKKDRNAELNDKKAELQKLKMQQRELAVKIDSMEKQIARLDPNAGSNTAQAKLVAVAPLQPAGFEHFVDLQGKIDADNISYVAPRGMGGVVTALYVRQGDFVRKGQVLAKLDDQLIRQQIDPLRVQLRTAEDTYRRLKNLYDQGIGTYQQLLQAETQVKTLKEQIGIIQNQINKQTVTAPSAGVANVVNIRVGEMFSPQTAAMAGIQIVNTGSLKITALVPENYLGRVGEGSTVEVTLPNLNKTFTTKVRVASKTIDPMSRSFQIEAPLPSSAEFKPGQIVIVKIRDYAATNAMTIPVNVLQNDDQGKFVMLAVKEGDKLVARKRRVSVGELYGDRLEVKSGLQAGDVVVTGGFQDIYEGQPLTVDGAAR